MILGWLIEIEKQLSLSKKMLVGLNFWDESPKTDYRILLVDSRRHLISKMMLKIESKRKIDESEFKDLFSASNGQECGVLCAAMLNPKVIPTIIEGVINYRIDECVRPLCNWLASINGVGGDGLLSCVQIKKVDIYNLEGMRQKISLKESSLGCVDNISLKQKAAL